MNRLIQEIDDTHVTPGSLRIWWIGQEGFVLKSPKRIVYIDPYLSTYAERITKGMANEHVRMSPAPMQPGEVEHADLVLCTHDHADHIDPDGIPVIAEKSPHAHFVVPECARETMTGFGIDAERLHTLRGDDDLVWEDLRIYGIPGKHEAFDEDADKGFPYLGYIIEIEGMTLFHAGDTIPYPGQVERFRKHTVDLAFVPINGRDEFRHKLEFEGNFTCGEAVRFALDIQAGLTIPMHYDMFTLNTGDVNVFLNEAARSNLRCLAMDHAGAITFPLENE